MVVTWVKEIHKTLETINDPSIGNRQHYLDALTAQATSLQQMADKLTPPIEAKRPAPPQAANGDPLAPMADASRTQLDKPTV